MIVQPIWYFMELWGHAKYYISTLWSYRMPYIQLVASLTDQHEEPVPPTKWSSWSSGATWSSWSSGAQWRHCRWPVCQCRNIHSPIPPRPALNIQDEKPTDVTVYQFTGCPVPRSVASVTSPLYDVLDHTSHKLSVVSLETQLMRCVGLYPRLWSIFIDILVPWNSQVRQVNSNMYIWRYVWRISGWKYPTTSSPSQFGLAPCLRFQLKTHIHIDAW